MADIDLDMGIESTMPWPQQVRRRLQNAVAFLTARPVTLPLQVAYQGPLTPAIARTFETQLDLLLRAGFGPRDAVALARMLPVLLAGLLLLHRAGPPGPISREEQDRQVRMAELTLLDLPADEFPLLRRHARLIGQAIVADSDRWLRQAIDLIVAGPEATLNEQEERAGD